MHQLADLLRKVRVAVLLGRKAATAWRRSSEIDKLLPPVSVMEAPIPSPLGLNWEGGEKAPGKLEEIRQALIETRRLAKLT